FYTEGVKLACGGSPAIGVLLEMQQRGVELVLCQTCLEYFGLSDKVEAGVVGGMGDILEAMQKAGKVISV
ncbi:sulfurtransferase-like selenium metabolism protein YedF, partial [bacterium]